MVHCVAFGCNNTSAKGSKGFFLFPKDDVYRKKWIDAVGSDREVCGKIVPFSPSSTSHVCMNHFEDACFVHPPSVMKSVGVALKLSLLKTAVPTKFPEKEEFRQKQKSCQPTEQFGPPKTKRKTHGAFEKRNRKDVVNVLIAEQNFLNMQKEETERRVLEEQQHLQELEVQHNQVRSCTPPAYDISAVYHDPLRTLVSTGSQTIETMARKPTANKGSQAKPKTSEAGMTALPEVNCTLSGPDVPIDPVDKCYQFPDPADSVENQSQHNEFDDEDNSVDLKDDLDMDPNWEPTDDDVCDDDEDDVTMQEDEEMWHDHIDDEDVVQETKYIVFDSCLRQLFLLCSLCGSACTKVTRKVLGTMLIIQTVCETGHVKVWNSQPVEKQTPVGNLLLSGAIMFSGASPTKVLNMLKFLNIKSIGARTYARFQRSFMIPAIANVWSRTQNAILMGYEGTKVKVGGDARCCSPGHTAKYGSYTIMDMQSGLVLAVELVQSNEVNNSNAMELEGLKRVMAKMNENNVDITDITTDRHVQVRKYLREETEVNHWFDGWHLAKGIKKKLLALSKKKGCESIGPWVQSIANHLYFCAATSGGDGDQVEQKWLSVLNHVTNKHEGHGDKYPRCLHPPIERNWILADSKAHKELKIILGNKRIIKDIRQLSPAEQTSQLEAQHKVVCQFAPKFVSFSYAGMKQRLNLAALHTCCNATRAQAVTKDGTPRFKISYPKYKAGHHVLKIVKEECSYEYVDVLLAEMVLLRKQYNSHKAAQEAAAIHLHVPPPVCSKAIRVTRQDAIARHRSRFGTQSSLSAYLNPV